MFVDENKGQRASIGYKNGKASLAVKGADKYSGAYITAYDNDGVHINIADSNLRSNLTLRSTDNELAMVMAAQKRTGLFYRAARGRCSQSGHYQGRRAHLEGPARCTGPGQRSTGYRGSDKVS